MADPSNGFHEYHGKTRYFAGCTIGRSLGSYTVVLLQTLNAGLDMTVKVVGGKTGSLEKLRGELAHFRKGFPGDAMRLARAAQAQSRLFKSALEQVMAECSVSAKNLSAIALEGTFVIDETDYLLEVLEPHTIAQKFGVPVGHGFRQSDLAAGGLGHPIFGVADRVLFPARNKDLLVLDLSAMLTATFLQRDSSENEEGHTDLSRISCFDIGLCNHLIDHMVRLVAPAKIMDDGASLAKRGEPQEDLFHEIVQHEFFAECPNRPARFSEFRDDWFETIFAFARKRLPEMDIIPSTVEAVAMMAEQLARELKSKTVILGGGGCQNSVLVDRMTKRLGPATVITSDDANVPSKWLHSCRVGILGALSRDGIPISLPQVTQVQDPIVAGSWVG